MGCACKATVLVVDDDDDLRACTAQMLTFEGYRAIEAAGASEAIGVLSKHEVDVLLTDIRMPGLSGFVLAEQARRIQPDLCVIYCTGIIPDGQWDHQRNGAVVLKPYDGDRIASAIREVMGKDRQEPRKASHPDV